MLKPLDGILVLETLHFADELCDPAELSVPKAEVGQKELDMALTLVKAMGGKWKPWEFHDEYRESLMKIIEQKVQAGAKRLPPAKGQPRAPEKIIDLVGLLQESLGQTQKRKAKAPRKGKALKKAA
jgi:DNA end-binding protein Ku